MGGSYTADPSRWPSTPSGSSSELWAAMAISAMVLAVDGSPLTNHLPFSHSRSSGDTSSMAAAISFALSRTRRVATATAAPDTGVEREP